MANRRLRIVKKRPPMVGVCERCNSEFKSDRPEPLDDIREQFYYHTCKLAPADTSANGVREEKWETGAA